MLLRYLDLRDLGQAWIYGGTRSCSTAVDVFCHRIKDLKTRGPVFHLLETDEATHGLYCDKVRRGRFVVVLTLVAKTHSYSLSGVTAHVNA